MSTNNHQNTNADQYESSWQSNYPKKIVIVLSVIQILLTVVICVLEIASLGIGRLYDSTGVGIWCAVPFATAAILTYLGTRKSNSRAWANRALIAQIVLIIFTCVLIKLTADYIKDYKRSVENTGSLIDYRLYRKFKVTQAELAFGVFLLFTGLIYLGIYCFVTYVALWEPYHIMNFSI